MADRQIVVDIFEEIVEAMRLTGTITGYTETSAGVYTIEAANELSFERKVSINGVKYFVNNVTATGFEIEGTEGIDFTGEKWTASEPFYLHGHPLDILSVLSETDQNQELIFEKYPLVILLQDFEEDHSKGVDLEMLLPRLRVLILAETEQHFDSKQRYDETYRPILYPLYNRLKIAMSKNRDLRTGFPEEINHRKWDRLFWGKEGLYGNESVVFNDKLDGIDIVFNNLEVLSRDNCNDN